MAYVSDPGAKERRSFSTAGPPVLYLHLPHMHYGELLVPG